MNVKLLVEHVGEVRALKHFVMYIHGLFESVLLIESTNSMIIHYKKPKKNLD